MNDENNRESFFQDPHEESSNSSFILSEHEVLAKKKVRRNKDLEEAERNGKNYSAVLNESKFMGNPKRNEKDVVDHYQTSETNSDSDSGDDEETMAEMERQMTKQMEHWEYRRRCTARNVHSDRPMLLSRRISYKMGMNKSDDSPSYSPLVACKLPFAESEKISVVVISRNARKRSHRSQHLSRFNQLSPR